MEGVYQHCGEQHLHRYLAEFHFRYNNRIGLKVNDEQRASKLLSNVKGKRLTYRTTDRKVTDEGADDKEQSERFIETAREHGSGETTNEFEQVFKRLVPRSKRPTTKR